MVEKPKKENPVDRSNIVSQLCFCWLLPYFFKGYKKVLTEDDMYTNRSAHDAETLGDKLEAAWKHQKSNASEPSLGKALSTVFLREFLLVCITAVCGEFCRLVQPYLISKMLTVYDERRLSEDKWDVYFYATILVICLGLSVVSFHYFVLNIAQVGLKMRIACSSLIYRKSLDLHLSTFSQISPGQIVNLLSNDVAKLENTIYLNHLFMAPIETGLVMGLIYMSVGWCGIVGAGLLILSMFISSYLGKKTAQYRLAIAKRTDKRIMLMMELLSGIEVIKMITWENLFKKFIGDARRSEIEQLRRSSYIRALSISFSLIYSKLAMFLSVVVYVVTGNVLTSSYVFTLTTFFRLLMTTIFFFPTGAGQFAEILISIRRIREFLLRDDLLKEHISNLGHETRSTGIVLEDVSASWSTDSSDLFQNVKMSISPGQLAALIGPSGSGKTTLLNVILRELLPSKGFIKISGSVSYASQEPWLFGGSFRENILFGEVYNERKYNEIIRICALERDFESLPFGDGTLTGDRGFALSGGQKCRINLARAIYRDAAIYLLDDPLSAVDSRVGKNIFQDILLGYLKEKTVILVTHQIQYLKELNNIYLLTDGTLKHFESYKQLMDFDNGIAKYSQETLDDGEENIASGSLKDNNVGFKSQVEKLEKEERGRGKLAGRVYKKFLLAGGHWWKGVLVGMLYIFGQISESGFDYFITFWINTIQNPHRVIEDKASDPGMFGELKNSFGLKLSDNHQFIILYCIALLFVIIFTLSKSFYFYKWCITVSSTLHANMFTSILYSPMKFFNQNPSGRILNRFSKDLGILDELIPVTLMDTLNIGLLILSVCLIIGALSPWILLPSAGMFLVLYYVRKVYLETSRDIKRVESVTRGPLYTHLTESIKGLTTIRAFGAETKLKRDFDIYQNVHSSAFFMYLGATRTYGFWLDMLCVIYIFFVLVFLLFVEEETLGGNMGLALSQVMSLTLALQRGMRQWGELENQLISVERIQDYVDLKPEIDNCIEPPKTWPENGRIEYKDIFLRYNNGSAVALNNVNFSIEPKEKIGIVGRTGAGKSSLIQAIMRIADIEGTLTIDGEDIKNISLSTLRSKVSIIPQVPILFSGTIRKNLDPYDELDDEVLWRVLSEVEMKTKIQELPELLDTVLTNSGASFSIGQKQLLCLARAILSHNKILFLDEATSNLDSHTDGLIQKTIRTKFADSTVLTIAHRLDTVLDSDKVLVMDSGTVVEFGRPEELLKKRDGHFYSLVAQSKRYLNDTNSY